jgi:hypothetical protein
MRADLAAALVLASLATSAAAGTEIVNGSFEDGLEGWTETTGATTGNGAARPDIAIDDSVASDGKRSLRVTGRAGVIVWPMHLQKLDVSAGQRISLRVAARCEGVAKEGRQYGNSNGLVMFQDAAGNRTGFLTTAVLSGDREWVDLGIDAIAPPGTAKASVGVFHSMTGMAWFDDVRVTVASTDPADETARAAAFDALEGHLRRTYSFWGIEGKPDADALFTKHRPSAIAAEDLTQFAGALRSMLAELDDVHVWMDTPLGRVGTAAPGPGAQFNVHAVLARLDVKLVHGRNVLAGWIGEGDDRVGYLLVATFSKGNPEWPLVEEALTKLADAPALVVDVRPNGGGDEMQGRAIAGRWTDTTVEYARQRWRDPTVAGLEGFGAVSSRMLEAAPEEQRFSGKVALLSGPACVSSTEAFLLMGKALPRVTVVGQPSRGASANPGAFAVFPNLTVWTSRWQSLGLDDRCIEGTGVPPDVVVDLAAGEPSRTKDPVLDAAVKLLRE